MDLYRFKSIAKLIQRLIFVSFKGLGDDKKCDMDTGIMKEESTRNSSVVDKSAATLTFTILGLKKEDIETVKQEIKKCCERESADIYISGSVYSDIIKSLDQLQVSHDEVLNYKNKYCQLCDFE